MGQDIYRREPVFRDVVDRCTQVLEPLLGLDLGELLYPSKATGDRDNAAAMLNRTEYAQPALFTIQYAAARTWMAWGIRPKAMLGHSVGEYTAACLAGVFDLDDALALLVQRGRLMASMPLGSMMAVFLSKQEIARNLDPALRLAAHNGEKLCVVSGPTDAIERYAAELERARIGHRALVTSHAFHSHMMDPILEAFTRRVRSVRLRPPTIPYVSNVTGDWITAEQATDASYWARHLRDTVRFHDGIDRLLSDESLVLLETGPGNSLCNMIRRRPDARGRVVSTMRAVTDDGDDHEALMGALGSLWMRGAFIDWDRLYDGRSRRRVSLPVYPFERHSYWIAARSRPERQANAALGTLDEREETAPDVASSTASPIGPRPALPGRRWLAISWHRATRSRPSCARSGEPLSDSMRSASMTTTSNSAVIQSWRYTSAPSPRSMA